MSASLPYLKRIAAAIKKLVNPSAQTVRRNAATTATTSSSGGSYSSATLSRSLETLVNDAFFMTVTEGEEGQETTTTKSVFDVIANDLTEL